VYICMVGYTANSCDSGFPSNSAQPSHNKDNQPEREREKKKAKLKSKGFAKGREREKEIDESHSL
jgi:hypothetical protein